MRSFNMPSALLVGVTLTSLLLSDCSGLSLHVVETNKAHKQKRLEASGFGYELVRHQSGYSSSNIHCEDYFSGSSCTSRDGSTTFTQLDPTSAYSEKIEIILSEDEYHSGEPVIQDSYSVMPEEMVDEYGYKEPEQVYQQDLGESYRPQIVNTQPLRPPHIPPPRPAHAQWSPAFISSRPTLPPPPSSGDCKSFRSCSRNDQQYRSTDGTCNNLEHSYFGAAQTPFRRELPRREMIAGCGSIGTSGRLPNPRLVSRLLIKRGSFDRHSTLSLMTMVWGQMIDHDIEKTPPRPVRSSDREFLDCCSPDNMRDADCCPIVAPRSDPFYGQQGRPRCMSFIRSKLVKAPCPQGRSHRNPASRSRDVVNDNTAWIDASFVYGSDPEVAASLRDSTGGLLKYSLDRRGRMFPPITNKKGVTMSFGDSRGDIHPGFTMLSTVFLRNHNKLAKGLAHINPSWNNERLFQEARKINIAVLQHINYAEFVVALLGRGNDVSLEPQVNNVARYDPTLDGSIGMGFATAGYRLHTYVPDRFILRNKHYRVSHSMLLRDVFHGPGIVSLLQNNTYDDIMRGLNAQPVQAFNNVFSREMTEWLFAVPEKNFGLDIAALNIQRGRDHMIPGYPTYREFCGLPKVSTWRDIAAALPLELAHRLSHTYAKPEDIDLYMGANMEPPVPGSILGPTNHCLIRRQFKLLRDGDRFFYAHQGQFSDEQLAAIRTQTLGSLLCSNADDPRSMTLPKEMFKMGGQSGPNRRFRCDDRFNHRRLDLAAWKE